MKNCAWVLLLVALTLFGCNAEEESSSDRSLVTFAFKTTHNGDKLAADHQASISGSAVNVTLPFQTDLTSLVASFTFIGDSVSLSGTNQVSGQTANDFSSTLTYKVTAANGDSSNYDVTVSRNSSALEGTWKSSCSQAGSNSYNQYVVVVSGSTLDSYIENYTDSACSSHFNQFHGQYQFTLLGSGTSSAGLSYVKINLQVEAMEYTPQTSSAASDANTDKVCGLTSWESKVTKDILGLTCSSLGGTQPAKDDYRYDIFRIDGTSLTFGSTQGTAEAGRPTSLSSVTYNKEES